MNDDDIAESTQTYTIAINIADNVLAQAANTLSVVVAANDVPVLSITPTVLTITEGTSAQLTIKANRPLADNIEVAIITDSNDLELTLTPNPLTITQDQTTATLTITAEPNDQAAKQRQAQLSFTIASGLAIFNEKYNTASITVPANDTPTVSFSQAAITTLEQETAQITLLVSPPPIELIQATIDFQAHTLTTERIASPSFPTTLTIQAGTPSTRITITPVDDQIQQPDQSATLTLTIASGFAQTSINNRLILTVLASDQPNSIELSPTQILISEGQATTLSISANSLQQATTLTLTSSHATQLHYAIQYCTQQRNNNTAARLVCINTRQTRTIIIDAIDDTQAELEQTYFITATAQTTSNETILINNNPNLTTITVTVAQNDAPTLTATLTPTLITEGTTATLTLTATAPPATTVTVMLSMADTDERMC